LQAREDVLEKQAFTFMEAIRDKERQLQSQLVDANRDLKALRADLEEEHSTSTRLRRQRDGERDALAAQRDLTDKMEKVIVKKNDKIHALKREAREQAKVIENLEKNLAEITVKKSRDMEAANAKTKAAADVNKKVEEELSKHIDVLVQILPSLNARNVGCEAGRSGRVATPQAKAAANPPPAKAKSQIADDSSYESDSESASPHTCLVPKAKAVAWSNATPKAPPLPVGHPEAAPAPVSSKAAAPLQPVGPSTVAAPAAPMPTEKAAAPVTSLLAQTVSPLAVSVAASGSEASSSAPLLTGGNAVPALTEGLGMPQTTVEPKSLAP